MCVMSVCECVREREREARKLLRCVCVCVCEGERGEGITVCTIATGFRCWRWLETKINKDGGGENTAAES